MASKSARAAGDGAGHKLVIVESPAKAKTIAGYLGHGYVVESSIGHIRDLPQSAADVPAKYKGEPWARLGVDVDNELHALLRGLARQEAAHHQAEGAAQGRRRALPGHRRGPRGRGDRLAPARRAEAEGPGPPDGLPRDHPARRSPRRSRTRATSTRTWSRRRRPAGSSTGSTATRSPRCCGRRSCPGCPPGRVQSVATRLVVDRERERMAFRAASYWDLDGTFDAGPKHDRPDVPGPAALRRRRPGRPGPDFDRARRAEGPRRPTGPGWCTSTGPGAEALADGAARRQLRGPLASSPSRTAARRTPRSGPPRCSRRRRRKLGFGASRTMSVAQRLYENGFITYMRTDSVTLSDTAIAAARQQVAGAVRRGVPARRARGSTPRRSRTPRRRTRRSGRPASRSGPRRRPGCPVTSSGSTS